jgi:predicted ABC-type ATPase
VTEPPRISVLAGVNGAGKSSLGGAMIRASGGQYYNPDEIAAKLIAANPGLDQARANALAWLKGTELLQRAIDDRLDFAIETTLGGATIPQKLTAAADAGIQVRVLYVGLSSPELHLRRVRNRVAAGGHDIPEIDIRRRWRHSRMNLISLLPALAELRVYDNSVDGDPKTGQTPRPSLVLHVVGTQIAAPPDLTCVPAWARPIAAAAMKLALGSGPE